MLLNSDAIFFISDDSSSDMEILPPGSSVMQDCLLDPGIFEATIIYPVKQLQSCCLASCLSLALLSFQTHRQTHIQKLDCRPKLDRH